jgi:regulator of protease activity HflC (stomatin/prohibitin superfamily)
VRTRFTRITVFDWEKGLKYQKGRFGKVLDAGSYWVYTPTEVVRKLDVRPRFVTIPGQEVLSSDGVTLKVSLAARYEIVRPEEAVSKSEDFVQALYLTVQLGLREIVGQAKKKRFSKGDRSWAPCCWS